MANFTCDIHPRLDVISPAEWARLFPDHPDSIEMIRVIQRAGLDGFTFHSLVIRDEGHPILLLPLFETTYDLATLLAPHARAMVTAAGRWLPHLFHPRLLGVGFVEGEWGQVGCDPSLGRRSLEAAWDLALTALDALAVGLRADLLAFVNFTPDSGRLLPMHKLQRFSDTVSLPYGRLSTTFPTMDAYVSSLSANMRSSLRRKMRKGHDVDVLRTRDPGPWLETIYQYYLQTVKRSDVVFGIHRRAYFEQVCEAVPNAEYWLYFARERLLAFRLVVTTPECLIDKYFGMDLIAGREQNLYFISWLENIRYCIEHHIPRYHAGQAEEDTKSRLGAQLIPSLVLFHHRNPLLHRLLTWVARHVSYEPKVNLPKAQLGTGWDGLPSERRLSLSEAFAEPSLSSNGR